MGESLEAAAAVAIADAGMSTALLGIFWDAASVCGGVADSASMEPELCCWPAATPPKGACVLVLVVSEPETSLTAFSAYSILLLNATASSGLLKGE